MNTPFTSQIRVTSRFATSILVLFNLFTAHYTNAQAPCGGGGVTVYSCHAQVTLQSPGAAGYTYQWYDDHCPPPQICQTPTHVGTGNSYTETLSDGDYYYHYEGSNGGNTCISGSIHVIVHSTFQILPLTHDSLPNTLHVNSSHPNFALMGYTDFQWYRNDVLISGATDSVYTAHLVGEYKVVATSSYCGVKVSPAVSLGCSATVHYSNYTFPVGTHSFNNRNLVFSGVIRIPAEATVNLSGCHINMKPGSEIIVEAATNPSTQNNGGILNADASYFSSCGQWGGIYAIGYDATLSHDSLGAILSVFQNQIYDAYIGVTSNKNSMIMLEDNIFRNNYRHLDIRDYSGLTFCNLTFTRGPEIEIQGNVFDYLLTDTSGGFTPLHFPLTLINQNYRKMVYMQTVRDITLIGNTFYSTNNTSWKENAMEVHEVSMTQCSGIGCNINDNFFDGAFNHAIHVENGTSIEITNDSIIGETEIGVYVYNSTQVIVSSNVINSTLSNPGGDAAISTKQVDTLEISLNAITWYHKGIEYYNTGVGQQEGKFLDNFIEHCNYGVLIAPVCDPTVSSSACSTQNVANYANAREVDITCNHIFYCEYGLVGTGDLKDQGDTTYEWETFFDYPSNGTSTTNYQGDIAFYQNVTSRTINFHYLDPYRPLWVSGSITVDGQLINSTSYLNKISLISNNYPQSCRGSFKPIQLTEKHLKVFPNPFNSYIIVNAHKKYNTYKLITIDGKIAKYGMISTEQTIMNTEGLSTGMYFLILSGPQEIKSVLLTKYE